MMKNYMLYLFTTKHVNTQTYFCDQTKAIATCSAQFTGGAQKSLFLRQILWFVAVS